MTSVTIPRGFLQLSGLLFKPSNTSSKTPALVIVHPGGGFKEQTASLYARHSPTTPSRSSATTLSSATTPPTKASAAASRISSNTRTPASATSGTSSTNLERLDSVNADKIGVLGVCAGGGYAVAAAKPISG